MDGHKPVANLPWFDRLTSSVPGYVGYDVHDNRRSAAFALRDALSRRLSNVRTMIDQSRTSCLQHEAISETHALDRLGTRLDTIIQRVGGLGTRFGAFYDSPAFDRAKLDPIYALDHALLETAAEIADRFQNPVYDRDLLANVQASLTDLENKLDERALLIRNLA